VRKRIAIALLILSVIGVVVFFSSLPKKGPVEWHKKEYLAAFAVLEENTWSDRFRRIYRRVVPPEPRECSLGPVSEQWQSAARAFNYHADSLVRLGYLQQTTIELTNAAALQAMAAGYRGQYADQVIKNFIFFSAPTRHTITVTAHPKDLPAVVEAIRKADVPGRKE
jgi:hypothetical protein